MLETGMYTRKSIDVEAVQVTDENIEEVARWCKGEVRTKKKFDQHVEEKHVKVRVNRPLTERQTKAFIGDWVLSMGTSFKVYTDKAFRSSFDAVDGTSLQETPQVNFSSSGDS